MKKGMGMGMERKRFNIIDNGKFACTREEPKL